MALVLEGIKPTRMELLKLKKRIVLAERGHRLLKQKRDALVAEFLKIVSVVQAARLEAEQQLAAAYRLLTAAQAVMGADMLNEISWNAEQDIQVRIKTRTIMGVAVPVLETGSIERALVARGYGLANTSSRLDDACLMMEQALGKIIRLAEVEEAVRRLAHEVEKTKRRVNALEYIVIPRLKATIKYILMRLDEIERENFTRLKKIKSILVAHPEEAA